MKEGLGRLGFWKGKLRIKDVHSLISHSVQDDLASCQDFFLSWQAGTNHGDYNPSFETEIDNIAAIANAMFAAEERLLQTRRQEAGAGRNPVIAVQTYKILPSKLGDADFMEPANLLKEKGCIYFEPLANVKRNPEQQKYFQTVDERVQDIFIFAAAKAAAAAAAAAAASTPATSQVADSTPAASTPQRAESADLPPLPPDSLEKIPSLPAPWATRSRQTPMRFQAAKRETTADSRAPGSEGPKPFLRGTKRGPASEFVGQEKRVTRGSFLRPQGSAQTPAGRPVGTPLLLARPSSGHAVKAAIPSGAAAAGQKFSFPGSAAKVQQPALASSASMTPNALSTPGFSPLLVVFAR